MILPDTFGIRCFFVYFFAAVVVLCISSHAEGIDSASEKMYPGISFPQHKLAQQAMHEFCSDHWDLAETTCVKMQSMEKADGGLPLSYLLRFGMRAWRILNNWYDDEQVKRTLLKEIPPLRKEGIRLLHEKHFPDSTLPTRLFIEGGLDGFDATLEIRSNPLVALVNGFKAVKMLDSAIGLAPYLKDACFGVGLFQCALAEEPGLVKVAIKILNGYDVNLDKGLANLRTTSSSAYYTREGALEYLIQFLSPFDKQQAEEKQNVFRLLQTWYPETPYYVFQEIDEGFAFHRESVFSESTITWAKSKIELCDTDGSSSHRYINLIRWQCYEIDSASVSSTPPEPFAAFHAYSFYPLFLQTARLRYSLDTSKSMSPELRKYKKNEYHRIWKRTVAVLGKSAIHPMLREYFLWHMEDGLPL